ncbi:MAG TPA: PIN domain-containing protein [Ilumatobacteraceae bacterium]|nr:PIN domain-containing protein [Ilumatobacteraceae bacterium]
MEAVIRLDTHVVVWLYTGEIERLSDGAVEALEAEELIVSPMVQLELTFLHEIGRLSVTGADIIGDLANRVGLRLSGAPMATVVQAAAPLTWTRDPFDRMIVADAHADGASLITKDREIHRNTTIATW